MDNSAKYPAVPARTAIFVAGMHRSGTSLLTRIVSLMGAALPRHLLPANGANAAGYWESPEFNEIHNHLLAALGTAWNRHQALPEREQVRAIAAPFQGRLLSLLERDFSGSSLFVVKDPRVSLLVPVWLDVLADFGAAPVFLIAVRHPFEVAASLQARDQLLPQHSHLLWLRYMLDAEWQTRGLRRCFVSYDQMLSDWRAVIRRIAAETELHWPREMEEAAAEIAPLIGSQHRHHHATELAEGTNQATASWVLSMYDALLATAEGLTHGQAEVFDAIAAAFNDAEKVYGPLLAAYQQTVHDLHQRQADGARRAISEWRLLLEQKEREIRELKRRISVEGKAAPE